MLCWVLNYLDQYNLDNVFDISTAQFYANNYHIARTTMQQINGFDECWIEGFYFNNAGTKMFLLEYNSKTIKEFSLSNSQFNTLAYVREFILDYGDGNSVIPNPDVISFTPDKKKCLFQLSTLL